MTVLFIPIILFFITTCTSITAPEPLTAPQLPTLAATAVPLGTESVPSGVGQSLADAGLPATNTPQATATRDRSPTLAPIAAATETLTPVPRSTATNAPIDDQPPPFVSSNSLEIASTLLPSDPVFHGTSIDFLTTQIYGSGRLTITQKIGTTDAFARYEYIYDSDGQLVNGFLNVPLDGEELPVALVLHGYIPPEEYTLLDYTARYADALARQGFVVFHPSYRGHPPRPTSRNENVFRIEYAIDVLNLMALISRADQALPADIDRSGFYIMGHSMGGGIAQRVMTVRPAQVNALVLYASMSGNEKLNYQKIKEWGGDRYWRTEFWAPESVLTATSPINYIDRWRAPVSIHHGTGDDVVPLEWSRSLCTALEEIDHPTECFEYASYPHSFYGRAETLFIERMVSFFRTHGAERSLN